MPNLFTSPIQNTCFQLVFTVPVIQMINTVRNKIFLLFAVLQCLVPLSVEISKFVILSLFSR